MHRRARHLNARDAGARIALDSRFISGLSNGASVATWSNRIGSSDFTSSGTAQPVFDVNSIGGNSTVSFDGVNDLMSASSITWGADFTLVFVAKLNRTTPYTPVTVDTIACKDDYITSGANRVGFASYATNTYATTTNTFAQTEWFVGSTGGASCVIDGASATATGGVTVGTPFILSANATGSNTNANTAFSVGGLSSNSFYGKINLGYMAYLPVSSTSLRRRFEQAAALSFKIACS